MPQQESRPKKSVRIKNNKKRLVIPMPTQQKPDNQDLFDLDEDKQEEPVPVTVEEVKDIDPFNEYFSNSSKHADERESLDAIFKRSISKFKRVDNYL